MYYTIKPSNKSRITYLLDISTATTDKRKAGQQANNQQTNNQQKEKEKNHVRLQ